MFILVQIQNKKLYQLKKLIPVVLIIVSLIAVVSVFSFNQQKEISYNNGLGWDGVKYNEVYNDIEAGKTITAKAPFVYRVGTPALASLLPWDSKLSFYYINIFFSILNTILFLIIMFKYVNDIKYLILFGILHILQWHGFFRFGPFYPVQVDPAALSFLYTSLILLQRRNNVAGITILVLVGTFFREIMIIPAILIILKHGAITKYNLKNLEWKNLFPTDYKYYLPLLAFVVSRLIITFITETTNDYKFYNAAFGNFYSSSLFNFIHAWFVAFGPVIFLLLIDIRKTKSFFNNNRIFFWFLLFIALLSFIGGTDTERIAYWSFPVVLTACAFLLRQLKLNPIGITLIVILLIIQIVFAERILFQIPDFPGIKISSIKSVFLIPQGENIPYLDLYASYADLKVALVGFAEYLILGFVFIFSIKKFGLKSSG